MQDRKASYFNAFNFKILHCTTESQLNLIFEGRMKFVACCSIFSLKPAQTDNINVTVKTSIIYLQIWSIEAVPSTQLFSIVSWVVRTGLWEMENSFLSDWLNWIPYNNKSLIYLFWGMLGDYEWSCNKTSCFFTLLKEKKWNSLLRKPY